MKQYHVVVNLVVSVVLLVWQGIGSTEIYKYQDEHGNWQFTDKPRDKNIGAKPTATYGTSQTYSNKLYDYQQLLLEKYKFKTPVESATLAVVMVKINLGSGSGFFVSGRLLSSRP